MNIENRIVAITKDSATPSLIELLLAAGGLRKVFGGVKKGQNNILRELLQIVDPEKRIDLFAEANFYSELKKLGLKRNKDEKEYYRVCGRFYGYPECCIEAFSKYKMPAERFSKLFFTKPPDYVLERIYHAYASHVPCEIECGETKSTATGYRNYILTNFPRIAAIFELGYLKKREHFLKKINLI